MWIFGLMLFRSMFEALPPKCGQLRVLAIERSQNRHKLSLHQLKCVRAILHDSFASFDLTVDSHQPNGADEKTRRSKFPNEFDRKLNRFYGVSADFRHGCNAANQTNNKKSTDSKVPPLNGA